MVAFLIFNSNIPNRRGLHPLEVLPNVPLVWMRVNELFEFFQDGDAYAFLMIPVRPADILDFGSVVAFAFPSHVPEHDRTF